MGLRLNKQLLNQSAHTALTDTEIIRLYLLNQDQQYFGMLYRKYAPKVFGKCLSLLRDEEAARDAMQDIFMKIMLNLSGFGERAQFSTWVYSITYNFCIDVIRKRKGKNLFTEDIEKAPDIAEEVSDEWLLDLEVRYLKRIMEALPIGDKAVLMMKYHDGMSIREISEAINKSESATKMQISRAKEKAQAIYRELASKDL